MILYCIDIENSPKLELYKEYEVYDANEYQFIVLDPNNSEFLSWEYKEKFTTLDMIRSIKLNQLEL